MTKSSFQSIILKLQNFWAERGAVLWQPYYAQVGAGTMNPASFLRVLGPEPWNVAYVEPSVRPDDGRYGENPKVPHEAGLFRVGWNAYPKGMRRILAACGIILL